MHLQELLSIFNCKCLLQYDGKRALGCFNTTQKSVVSQSLIKEHTACSLLIGDNFSSQIILLRKLQETIHGLEHTMQVNRSWFVLTSHCTILLLLLQTIVTTKNVKYSFKYYTDSQVCEWMDFANPVKLWVQKRSKSVTPLQIHHSRYFHIRNSS